ncbi:MAG: hypothetical protein V1934_09255 [Methanobacteriota archaeon]
MKSITVCKGCERRRLTNMIGLCKRCNKEAPKYISKAEMDKRRREHEELLKAGMAKKAEDAAKKAAAAAAAATAGAAAGAEGAAAPAEGEKKAEDAKKGDDKKPAGDKKPAEKKEK